MNVLSSELRGVFRCVRYAFMPNRLHLCGPEKQADILEFYSQTGAKKKTRPIDPILKEFETLYPYLKLIARANQIKNPFNEKVIEAYWLGNEYLEKVSARQLYDHVGGELQLKKKTDSKNFKDFTEKFDKHALPHHNFHVFGVYRRTGNMKIPHTLATMDACRISWGTVTGTGSSLKVKTRPLSVDGRGKIEEANSFVERDILNIFEGSELVKNLKIGDSISLHWGCVCERLNDEQVADLQKYTNLSLKYAVNLT